MTYSLRTFTISSILLGGLGACSGDGNSNDVVDGVRIDVRDVYQSAGGEATALSAARGQMTFTAYSGPSGAPVAYPGALSSEGEVHIAGVPAGPYLLELTTPPSAPEASAYRSFYELSERNLNLSTLHSYRSDVQAMTQATYLNIDAPLTRPWQAGVLDEQGDKPIVLDDSLYAYSSNAFLVGSASGGDNGGLPESPESIGAPRNGATSLAWQLDVKAMVETLYGTFPDTKHLVDASKGDDFTLMHLVAKPVRIAGPPPAGGGADPWRAYAYNALEEVLTPAPFTMTDGGTTSINGAFTALPQKTFALDYEGAAFNDLLRDAPSTAFSSVLLSFALYHEPIASEQAEGGFGELLDFSLSARNEYVDPICNPDNQTEEGTRTCDDQTTCPAGCNDQKALGLPGDHAYTYSYGNPFEGGQETASLFYNFNSFFGESITTSTLGGQLRGRFFVMGPAAEYNGTPLAPLVGLARNVTLNGQPAPVGALTRGVGPTPTISFEPPALGVPNSYRVIVNKIVVNRIDPDFELASGAQIASVTLQGTSLTLPAGVLEAGSNYYVQVEAAIRESTPSGSILRYGPRLSGSTTFTGAFTP